MSETTKLEYPSERISEELQIPDASTTKAAAASEGAYSPYRAIATTMTEHVLRGYLSCRDRFKVRESVEGALEKLIPTNQANAIALTLAKFERDESSPFEASHESQQLAMDVVDESLRPGCTYWSIVEVAVKSLNAAASR